jgi:hypothetical protein
MVVLVAMVSNNWGEHEIEKVLEESNVGGVGFLIFTDNIVHDIVGTCVGMLVAGDETV